MTNRLSEQEKVRLYPVAKYATATSEFFDQDGALVCFAQIETSPTQRKQKVPGLSYFANPVIFMWVGKTMNRLDAANTSPISIQEVFQSHANDIRLFVRPASSADWIDIGSCLLNGITATEGVVDVIYLRLSEKLPEPLWHEFGGHPGWHLTINNVESEAASPDAVMEAIRDAWKRPPVDVEIGRYAGDGLFAIADEAGRATVNYWSFDNKEFVSGTPQLFDATVETHIFLRSNSYDHEVAMGQVITPGEALSIIESFVLTGKPAGLTPWSVLFQEGERADVPNS